MLPASIENSSLIMIVAGINPHRLSPPGSLKSALAVELNGPAVGDQQVLMKASVTRQETPHQFRADPTLLIFRVHQQVRIVNDEMTVGNRVAKSD